jgi:MFS family permease
VSNRQDGIVNSPDDRAFRRLFAAAAVSNLGDGVHVIAPPLLAATLTRDPRLISLLGVAGSLPWLVFGLVSGGIVDRADLHRLMVRVDIVRAFITGALVVAVGTGRASMWLLLVVTLLLGIGETLFDTASQAYVPSVVSLSRLPWANGRIQSARIVTNELVGPAIGGLLFAWVRAVPFVMNAVSFFGSSIILGRRRSPPAVASPDSASIARGSTLRSEIADGMRFLAHDRSLRMLAIIVGAWNLFGHLGDAVFVLYAQDVLGLSSRQYGLMNAVIAGGAAISTLVASRVIDRFGKAAVLHTAIVSASVPTVLVSLTTNVAIVVSLFFFMTLMSYAWNVVSSSLRQSLIPKEYLGRVIAAYFVIAMGTTPIGALAGGLLAKWLGFRPLFAISGTALTVLAIVSWRPLTRVVHHANAAIVAAS